MGKVLENKQIKEQNLLNTAFQLFTTKGFAKTSISDIVAQAGVAKGTFYLYFRDKYDIRDKLIARKAGQMFQHALTRSDYAQQTNFPDKLIVVVDDILDQMQRNPTLLRFINKNLSWGLFHRVIDQSSPNYVEIVQELLQRDTERNHTKWREPKLMLYTIVELVGSTCHSVILEQDPVDLEEYKPHLYRSVRAIVDSFREE